MQEQKALDSYLKYFSPDFSSVTSKASFLLSDTSPYRELLRSHFHSPSEELSQWMSAPYERSQNHPEHLVHKSLSGNKVRSKSEALIDYALYTNKIPYRYECALSLGELLIFPDFTIRHPKTGELFYWEHFGMMDDPSYTRNAFRKLNLYADHGILPFHNLITTFETSQIPLTSSAIDKILHDFFL